MKKPIAVLISDIHFNLNNLELASASLEFALQTALRLNVRLVIAGDLNDTKAILRGEVVNALISLFQKYITVEVTILVGNHDRLHEQNPEHSLNFLAPHADIIALPKYDNGLRCWLVPYQTDLVTTVNELKAMRCVTKRAIMHQGLKGSDMGEYISDPTAIDASELPGWRVISGHYHKAQDIPLPDGGRWSYIGTPYTITFAEANDGPKGIRVLNSDDSLDFIPTDLRKHVKVERAVCDVLEQIPGLKPIDKLWLKVTGHRSLLERLSKTEIGLTHLGHGDFKLDLIPIESNTPAPISAPHVSHSDQFDSFIAHTVQDTIEHKTYLKTVWRSLK